MTDPVVARALDPDGREVLLRTSGWEHVLDGHPELSIHLDQVMRAIGEPAHRIVDQRPGRERFFRRTAGPSSWTRVVVDCSGAEAVVVTAFPERRDPPGWSRSTR